MVKVTVLPIKDCEPLLSEEEGRLPQCLQWVDTEAVPSRGAVFSQLAI